MVFCCYHSFYTKLSDCGGGHGGITYDNSMRGAKNTYGLFVAGHLAYEKCKSTINL